jgi:hypothetical protein
LFFARWAKDWPFLPVEGLAFLPVEGVWMKESDSGKNPS